MDYDLFVGRKLCGVIEAKPEAQHFRAIPSRRRGTSRMCRSISSARKARSGSNMLLRARRRCFATTPTLIRCRAAFLLPAGDAERELREPLTLRGRLRTMPPFITDGLRACQIDRALEASMAQNRPRALVQMATGAGKTFTACTLSYRLLAHAGFKRILFLADRANLVRQTRDEYLAYRPPGTGRSFSEIYNVQKLGAAGLDKMNAQIG